MLLSLALLLSAVELNVYYAWGWHGGYYLTSEAGTREAFDKLFDVLEATPHAKAVLELEPYTLERMLFGEKFEIEWRGRRKERPIGWSHGGRGRWEFAYGAQFARNGKNGIRLRLISGVYVNFCQPLTARHLRGKVLVFSGYVRAVRGAGAHLYIDAWDRHAYIQGSTRVSKRIPPDGKWHFVSVEFTVPETAFTIFPQAKIATEPSVADFDDLSLKVKETGEELLFNGNFELLR
ncbi:MAG TPA: hypothetical protein EYP10_00610, partial [Armatimonadetes bacterium]|nr:hypothetical protein [Armatimonadota bacterium]